MPDQPATQKDIAKLESEIKEIREKFQDVFKTMSEVDDLKKGAAADDKQFSALDKRVTALEKKKS